MREARTALVTGAGSGIGAACAERFLAQGHRVVAVDLRAGRMADRSGELQAIVEIDVSDAAAVDAIEGIDEVDIVVQCAAVSGPIMPLTEVSPQDWDRTMAVNVSGIVNVMRASLAGNGAPRLGPRGSTSPASRARRATRSRRPTRPARRR